MADRMAGERDINQTAKTGLTTAEHNADPCDHRHSSTWRGKPRMPVTQTMVFYSQKAQKQSFCCCIARDCLTELCAGG